MSYRDNTPPQRKPERHGWPYEDAPRTYVAGRAPDDVDAEIDLLVSSAERGQRLEAAARFVFVATVFVFVVFGAVYLVTRREERDEAARRECVQRGGHVEQVHNVRHDRNAWVCLGSDETRP
jgi:hypothetical protein